MVIKKRYSFKRDRYVFHQGGYTASPMIGSRHSGPCFYTGSCAIAEDTNDYPAYFAPLVVNLY